MLISKQLSPFPPLPRLKWEPVPHYRGFYRGNPAVTAAGNTVQVSNLSLLKETGSTESREMICHPELMVENHAQVRHRMWRTIPCPAAVRSHWCRHMTAEGSFWSKHLVAEPCFETYINFYDGFLLGFELLNPNPFGARLQMLSIFFYSPFFQDGRQNLESCISWLADVIESSTISLNVCSWDQGIYFFENYSL